MWNVFIRSAEKRDDGNFYIIVDFASEDDKKSKEYLIDSPTKTLDWLKSEIRNEISRLNLDPAILAIPLGDFDPK